MEEKRLALLIDADNISSKYIRTIVEEGSIEGVVTYKRIYGDWTKPNLEGWKNELLNYSINPIQQYAYTKGKNATDSAMIIDAMDILYTGNVDGFLLVSSDSDFTRLASRLKESGMVVIGMGKTQTPKPFVAACSKFKYLDVISDTANLQSETIIEKNNERIAEKRNVEKTIEADNRNVESSDASSQTPLSDVLEFISKIISEFSDDEGWVLASLVGINISKQYSDFDVRNYGQKKLVEFLEQNGYDIKKQKDPNNVKNPSGYVIYVRNRT